MSDHILNDPFKMTSMMNNADVFDGEFTQTVNGSTIKLTQHLTVILHYK